MKKLLIVLGIGLASILGFGKLYGVNDTDSIDMVHNFVGRYQMVYGTMEYAGKPFMKTMFKIDSITGRVWVYIPPVNKDDKNTSGAWEETGLAYSKKP